MLIKNQNPSDFLKAMLLLEGFLRQFAPSETLPPPEIWSENNSITKEICITVDFPPEKFLEESQFYCMRNDKH